MISNEKQKAIRALSAAGHTVTYIARRLDVSMPTVRSYIRDETRGDSKSKTRNRKKILENANQDALKEWYVSYGYNSTLLAFMINKDPAMFGLPSNFKITARTVRRYMPKIAPMPTHAPERIQHFESAIGQQLQIDFTFAKYTFYGETKPRKICVFEAVYPWSHKTFFTICPDLTQASWLRGITECLLKNGIPKEILCDNDKSLVIDNDGHGNVRFNTEFLWFCNEFGIDPRACRPGRPQTKGAVERAGRFLKENGLKWVKATYPDISNVEQLNVAIQEWNDIYATNERTFEAVVDGVSKRLTVRELFALESKELQHVDPKLSLTIASKVVRVNQSGAVYIHGVKIQFSDPFRNSDVCVLVCSNGNFMITNMHSYVLEKGTIPAANMITYKFSDRPSDEFGQNTIHAQENVGVKAAAITDTGFNKTKLRDQTSKKQKLPDPLVGYRLIKKEKKNEQ